MLGITSKCRVGLCVVRQHPCMSTESEDGSHQDKSSWVFSPNTDLAGGADHQPHQTQAKPTPDKTEIILLLKEVVEYRLGQEEEMNQNTPNPGLALRWPIFLALSIEWGKESVPQCQSLTTSGTGHPGLAPARDGDGRSYLHGDYD